MFITRTTFIARQARFITNEDSSRPLRAPGHPQACFAMESLMDELADKIGMDPVEFRIKNLDDSDDHIRQLHARSKGNRLGAAKPDARCDCRAR